jgi:hypothetical protein
MFAGGFYQSPTTDATVPRTAATSNGCGFCLWRHGHTLACATGIPWCAIATGRLHAFGKQLTRAPEFQITGARIYNNRIFW